MGQIEDGTYRIYNKKQDSDKNNLAIHFSGKDKSLNVKKYSATSETQKFKVAKYDDNTKTITPVNDTSLQAAFGTSAIATIKASDYTWRIYEDDQDYSIQDGASTVSWGIEEAKEGTLVTSKDDEDDDKQRWIFEKA